MFSAFQDCFGTLDQTWGVFHVRNPSYPRQKPDNFFSALVMSLQGAGIQTEGADNHTRTHGALILEEGCEEVGVLGENRGRLGPLDLRVMQDNGVFPGTIP